MFDPEAWPERSVTEGGWTIDDPDQHPDADRAEEDIRDRVSEYLDGDHDGRTTDQPYLVELLSEGLFDVVGSPFDLPAYALSPMQQFLHGKAIDALVDFLDSLPLRDEVVADEIQRDAENARYNERETTL